MVSHSLIGSCFLSWCVIKEYVVEVVEHGSVCDEEKAEQREHVGEQSRPRAAGGPALGGALIRCCVGSGQQTHCWNIPFIKHILIPSRKSRLQCWNPGCKVKCKSCINLIILYAKAFVFLFNHIIDILIIKKKSQICLKIYY